MPFRFHRPAALFAALALLFSPLAGLGGAWAQNAASPRPPATAPKDPPNDSAKDSAKDAKEPSVGQSAARERQKKCGAEWRALSVSDKAAQGPKWPQYYSKCVKRLKQIKA